jgi:hypothetical protein
MPNPVIYTEPGNNLPLISLGGVVSNVSLGRVMRSEAIASGAVTGGAQLLLGANPKRISAIIQNSSVGDNLPAVNDVYIFLGGPSGMQLVLAPLGTLQIDKDFPWIGEIWFSSVDITTLPIVSYSEVSLT